MKPVPAFPSAKTLWWLYAIASLSLLTTLWLPYVGEEAVYTIISLDMWANREFFLTTLLGTAYARPPFLNWLMVPLANFMGWEYVLQASRLVTAAATVATGGVLAWLTAHLTRNPALAAFAALVYLSGDVLFYRGWLAYSDSLFALCVFAAIACTWVAAERDRTWLIWIGMAALTCGFLTKVQTAYVFYGVAFTVLFFRRDYRRVLLRPNSIAAHLAGAAAFILWNLYMVHGAHSTGAVGDVMHKFRTAGLANYLNQLWTFPVETFLRFLPASVLAAYFWYRERGAAPGAKTAVAQAAFPLALLVWMTALNFLPYWWWPESHIRYIMPIYPLITLIIAGIIWQAGAARMRLAVLWLAVFIALKYVLALWAFPAYQEKFRGNYAATAANILERTRGFPLYAVDFSATGLSVGAHIYTTHFPQKLTAPPDKWDNGYVLAYTADPQLGQVSQRYQLGGNELFLLCRGPACRAGAGENKSR